MSRIEEEQASRWVKIYKNYFWAYCFSQMSFMGQSASFFWKCCITFQRGDSLLFKTTASLSMCQVLRLPRPLLRIYNLFFSKNWLFHRSKIFLMPLEFLAQHRGSFIRSKDRLDSFLISNSNVDLAVPPVHNPTFPHETWWAQ